MLALFSVLLLPALLTPARADASVSVSVSIFYEELLPHGRWVTVADYGEVWCPNSVASGWQPYSNGEWLYTDYGWTWASYDPWSADTFHYGTWVHTRSCGWVWVPGTVWAPAWVTWSYRRGYVGWAPIPLSASIGWSGYSGRAIVAPVSSYVFVPATSFAGVNVATVRYDPVRNPTLLSGATKLTRFDVSGGVVRTSGPAPAVLRGLGANFRESSLSAAKTRAVPISAGIADVGRGKHFRVVASSEVRSAELRRGGKPIANIDRPGPVGKLERGPIAAQERREVRKGVAIRRDVAPAFRPSRPERSVAPHPARIDRPGKAHVIREPRPQRIDAPVRMVEPARPPRAMKGGGPPMREHPAPARFAPPPQEAPQYAPPQGPGPGHGGGPPPGHGGHGGGPPPGHGGGSGKGKKG